MSNPFDQFDASPDIAGLVTAEAQRQGVDPALAMRVARQESGLNPAAVSPKGAVGVMQLMPGTARDLGVDPTDPAQNVQGGVTYLKQQLDRFGDPKLALAAYNAGPGAVQRAGGVPDFPETQAYVGATAPANPFDQFDAPAAAASNAPAPAPAAQAPTQTPVVINPQTHKPYNDAQEATYAGLIKSGKLDPNATPGSQAFPRGLVDAADRPNPGDWYVDTSGKLQQAPGLAEDVGKGFLGGVERAGAGIQDAVMSATPLGGVQQILANAATLAQGKPGLVHPFGLFGANAQAHTYQPKTTPGAYAATIGEMVPNAVTPGGLLRKGAAIVLPAIGSQAAGDVAQANGAGPTVTATARFAGGLLGGLGAGLGFKTNAPAEAPSVEQLKAASDAAWKKVDASGFRFPQKAAQQTADDLKGIVDEADPELYPESAKVAASFQRLAANGDLSAGKLNRFISRAGEKLFKPGSDEVSVGGDIMARLRSLIDDANDPNIAEAKQLYKQYSKAKTVSDIATSADLKSQTTYSGTNYGNTVRQRLEPLMDPTSRQQIKNLTPDEQAALEQVVRGTTGQNITRRAAKTLGNKFVQTGAMIVTPHGIGYPLMEGLGAGLRKMYDTQTERSVESLINLMASGGKKGPPPVSLTYNPGPLAPVNVGSLIGLLQGSSAPAAGGFPAPGVPPQPPALAPAPRR